MEIDEDSGELYGRVIGLRDVVTFVGRTVEEARKSFEESVDYYLESCQKSERKPDAPFAGQFLVRVDSETHRRLAILAAVHKLTLNDVVSKALNHFVATNELWANEEIVISLSSDPAKLEQDQAEAAARRGAKKATPRNDTTKKTG